MTADPKVRAYAAWLAERRGISIKRATAIATAPRPQPFAPPVTVIIERWNNVVPFARPISVVDRFMIRYGRQYGDGA